MGKYGVNKVTLIGKVGQRPELSYDGQGLPHAWLTLAITEPGPKGDATGTDETQWISLHLAGELAETMAPKLTRTMVVYVEARLQNAQPTKAVQSLRLVAHHLLILSDARPAKPPFASAASAGQPRPSSEENDALPF
jgi:single-stranded DNA-binding protein